MQARAGMNMLRQFLVGGGVSLVNIAIHALPDEIDKRFFVNWATLRIHSFVRPRHRSFFRPGRRSRSRRAQGRSRLAAFAAAARLGLDRPEHGGTLARTGLHSSPAWNLPSVATTVVGRGRPRGEAWRVGCKRHRTALIRSCRAEAPARRLLAAAVSIAPRSARNCAPLGRQAASRGLEAP